MKKNFITIGMALISALFITTNCAKEEVSPINEETRSEAVSFKLNVSAQETRTTTEDGATVNWDSGDAINVFHAVTGTTEYGSNDKFTLAEGTTFNGELKDGALDESKTYDWYVMYPYVSYITTPANTSTGYTTVGSLASGSQTQNGNDDKAHLAGTSIPLYGKTTGVAATETPSITLKQAVAVVKVHVTNSSDEPLTVTDVAFTGTEDIVGSYYIDFSGDAPAFKGREKYVSEVAKLTVNSGTAIKINGSADFYIAVKPFTANGTLKVAVNGYEKDYSVTNKTFSAGKIKTVNFSYDRISTAKLNFEISGEGGFAAYSSVAGMSSSGIESDYASSNSPYLAKFDNTGDYVQVRFNEAAGKASIGVKMLGGATTSHFIVKGSTDGTSFETIQTLTVSGATNSICNLSTTNDINSEYRFIRFEFDKGDNVGVGPITITKPTSDPEIIAEDIAEVPAAGVTDATTTYSVKNFEDDVKISGVSGIVTSASVNNSTKKITYSVAPNYQSSVQTGKIILESTSNAGVSKTISVSQLKSELKVDGGTKNITVIIPKEETSVTFTVTSAELDWLSTVDPATGMNLSVNPASGNASAEAQTVTITSTTEASEDEQTLGTIVVFRGLEEKDSQKRTITVKKASTANVLYSTGFESGEGFTAGTSYQTTVTQGPEGKKWETYYGTVSTSSKITGSNSLAMRLYPSENYAYSKMLFDVEGSISQVSFKAKAGTSGGASIKLTIEYSTDSGTTWNAVSGFTAKELTSTANDYSFAVTGNPTKYRLRFSIDPTSTRPESNKNAQLTIDDIKFTNK